MHVEDRMILKLLDLINVTDSCNVYEVDTYQVGEPVLLQCSSTVSL